MIHWPQHRESCRLDSSWCQGLAQSYLCHGPRCWELPLVCLQGQQLTMHFYVVLSTQMNIDIEKILPSHKRNGVQKCVRSCLAANYSLIPVVVDCCCGLSRQWREWRRSTTFGPGPELLRSGFRNLFSHILPPLGILSSSSKDQSVLDHLPIFDNYAK